MTRFKKIILGLSLICNLQLLSSDSDIFCLFKSRVFGKRLQGKPLSPQELVILKYVIRIQKEIEKKQKEHEIDLKIKEQQDLQKARQSYAKSANKLDKRPKGWCAK